MTIIALEKDYSFTVEPEATSCGVHATFEHAKCAVYARMWRIAEATDISVSYVNNGIRWCVTSAETGELLREYAIQKVDF